ILVCLSDPLHQADRRAAARLAEADQRIRIVEAQAPGPAAARNAGIRIARGDRLAFIDDDCVPQPGWLAAGVTALENVDLVQGHTWSAEALSVMPFGYHSVWCDSLSLLWESCNLFVRRSAIERAGPFDEEYNPTRQAHGHWGEDAEWGWRLIRNGARYVFAPDARVAHAVTPRSIHALIEYKSRT